MLSMFAIAAVRSGPRVRAEGSLNVPPSAVVPAAAGAGDGVAGMLDDEVLDAGAGAGAGAAGVEGVCTAAGAGVDGALTDDEADELTGAVFGYSLLRLSTGYRVDATNL